jgi:hypothetical protein
MCSEENRELAGWNYDPASGPEPGEANPYRGPKPIGGQAGDIAPRRTLPVSAVFTGVVLTGR